MPPNAAPAAAPAVAPAYLPPSPITISATRPVPTSPRVGSGATSVPKSFWLPSITVPKSFGSFSTSVPKSFIIIY